MKARVIRSTGSWYIVRTESDEAVNCRLPGRFKQEIEGITNPVAVGDWVRIEQNGEDWMIEEIYDRQNYLIRKASRMDKQFHIVASNLDLAVVIATIHSPRTSTGFIDRFLVSCFSFGIQPALVINKVDLCSEKHKSILNEWTQVYSSLGMPVLLTALIESGVPQEFMELIQGKTSLLFGHSGVGKSTLINCILGESKQRVAAISGALNKGRHTTTHAESFTVDNNTYLIDTPGIREFGLAEMEAWELSHYSPDFLPHLENCAFNTCLHVNEPRCGVQTAVEQGKIANFRYLNYLRMLEADFNVPLTRIPPLPD